MRIILTGGTGFVGSMLVPRLLDAGHAVVLLTRDPSRVPARPNLSAIAWDGERDPLPGAVIETADAVIHLAGENVAGGRWTDAMKRRILDSRVRAGESIRTALAARERPLPLLIAASAIGFYGDAGEAPLPETASSGKGFLADVCRKWEASLAGADARRQVTLRFGVILGKNGGALGKMLPPFRLGVGGKIGSGEQWMAWIHLDDAVELIVRAVTDATYAGTYNAVAPAPVRNAEFVAELASALHRPKVMTVPAIALRLAFGQMAEETVLASQRVIPARLRDQRFSYRYPDLPDAIRSVI